MMKKIKIFYWIVTGLLCSFMLFSAIPNVLESQESIAFITNLGYPDYFVKFIGVAKVLGVIAILLPGFPRLKEWAYAGLFYDLAGAGYSLIAKNGVEPGMAFLLLPILFLFGSYYLYHRIKAAESLKPLYT